MRTAADPVRLPYRQPRRSYHERPVLLCRPPEPARRTLASRVCTAYSSTSKCLCAVRGNPRYVYRMVTRPTEDIPLLSKE